MAVTDSAAATIATERPAPAGDRVASTRVTRSWARRGFARPLGWLALGMAGQAVSLTLVHAGNLIGYQHYLPPAALYRLDHLPALLFLLAEATAVALGLRPLLPELSAWLRPRLARWQVAVIGAAFFATSATLSRSPLAFGAELVLATVLQLVHLGAFVLVAASIPPLSLRRFGGWLDRLLGRRGTGPEPGGADRFALATAAAVTLAAAFLAFFVYQRHPHVPDELVYLIPARYFAHGQLWLPPPPVPAGFDLDLMTMEATRWYSPVPPAWPAILALGALVHAEWLVDPVLGGVNVLLAYVVLRELYDRRTARAALLLLAVSPWFVFMSMNFMTHTASFTCALVAALGAARLRRQVAAGASGRALGWAVAGGAALGWLGLLRPLEGMTAAVVIGSFAFFGAGWRRRFAPVALMAVACAAVALLTLPYNRLFTGSPTVFPLMAYTDAHYGKGSNALGFGPNRGLWAFGTSLDPRRGHDLLDVFINADFNAFSINTELFGWAAGSVLLLFFALTRLRRLRAGDRAMAAMLAAIVFVHTFYWFSGGPDFGARYWYLVLLPCVVLTVRGVQLLATEGGPAVHSRSGRARVSAAIVALSLTAVAVFVPWRAVDKYYHYRTQRPDVRYLAAEHRFGRSLVLVHGSGWDYAGAAIYNPLDLRAAAPIYAWDRDPRVRAQLLRAYADRPVWLLDAPTVTGAGFRLVGGPIPARTLLARDAAGANAAPR